MTGAGQPLLADGTPPAAETEGRSGRPRLTSRRTLERIALELFLAQGYEETTVEQISDLAGVSRRTFFRYFDNKAAVIWSEFDTEVATLRQLLADADPQQSIGAAIKQAVLAANHYGLADVAALRGRMLTISTVPALGASASVHYDAWATALAEFVGKRLGQPADALIPQTVGFSALGACRAAFDQWVKRHDSDLISYLDAALSAWKAGFATLGETFD
jgi:TetR/AcrR family transcriptional regulator, regulator of mycofactocin system